MAFKILVLAFLFVLSIVSAQPYTESPLTAVDGSYSIPSGASADLCVNYVSEGQCIPPSLSDAESLCAADSNCGGINCHSDNTVCTLRYYPLTTPYTNTNYNFYAKKTSSFSFSELPGVALDGTYTVPSGTSSNLCLLFNNDGQCIPPTLAAAQTLCDIDANCAGVNCHSDNTVCTLRYLPLTAPYANSNYNAYYKLQQSNTPYVESPLTAVDGSYSIPSGASADLCANYVSEGQCIPPSLSDAESLCAADSNCGGINCHSDNTVCTLRYYPLTTPYTNTNYNFYAKKTSSFSFSELPGVALDGTYTVPSGTSSNLCLLFNNDGQCIPPTLAAAQTLCDIDANCAGVNCHSDNTVCTLRYLPLTAPYANSNYDSYYKHY